jgi:predicted butyrate kinase (DUF1464 family)
MPRVIGIDPGTISIDLCGLDDGRVFLDRSLPTADALADASLILRLVDMAHREAPVDLIAGPSGYGLPFVAARDLTPADLRLAQLAPERDDSGGIVGLGALMRELARASAPVIFTPGVVQLASVPPHRKVNRVDMGTADKVCAAALAIDEQARRRGCGPGDVSLLLLELGGAFTAVLAVDRGCIVDGAGGTSGPLGIRGAGALDGEVAFLAGSIQKRLLFGGGAATIAGAPDLPAEALASPSTDAARLAWEAYLESAVKGIAAMSVAVRGVRDVVLSGRVVHVAGVRDELARRISAVLPDASVDVLTGFAAVAKHAAQGAALVADGLAGGQSAALVDAMRLREAHGTVLDYLYVITPEDARRKIGI